MNINTVSVTGNLTRDPELAYTPSGVAVVSLGVAHNRSYKKQGSDDWSEEVSYLDAVVFGKEAERVAPLLIKGCKVIVHGRLHQDRWETNEGEKRSKVKIVAVSVAKIIDRMKEEGAASTSDDEYYA